MDIELYYEEVGDGIPFIMLHGNGEDGNYFEHQKEYFSKKYRVLTIDTRGHGKSSRGTAPFTIEQFAEDLNCFLEEYNIDKAIILGFSDGANIAMKFALKYSSKIIALILNSGNLSASGVKRTIQFPIEIGYKIASKFADKSSNAKKNAEMLGLMVNEPNMDRAELSVIKVPTLVIAGTRDMIKESHTKEIANAILESKIVFVKGNHFIANKNYSDFNYEVENFLTSNIL